VKGEYVSVVVLTVQMALLFTLVYVKNDEIFVENKNFESILSMIGRLAAFHSCCCRNFPGCYSLSLGHVVQGEVGISNPPRFRCHI